jgi:restriction endonuclease S subunit
MVKYFKTISNIITGHVFRNKIPYNTDGNINLLNMDAISTAGIVRISENDIKKIQLDDIKPEEIIMPGDILFKAKGLNNTAVLIDSIPANTTVTASCHIIRVTDKNFLPEYVCSWLNSAAAKKHFSKSSGQATGVTIANVSKATLESLEIPLIPLKNQKLISEIEECSKQEKELLLKIAEKKEMLNRAIIEKELQKY